jgi:hypothetical protein
VAFTLLPDIEQQLVVFLAGHASLTPLHGGRVGTELQSDLACLQVTALGGPQPWPWEAVPEFQISSWGVTKADAVTLDRTLRSAIYDLHGTAVTGGRVISVAIRLAGLWSPADDTGRPRVRTDIALTVMP